MDRLNVGMEDTKVETKRVRQTLKLFYRLNKKENQKK